jgi:hypothetical protein
MRSGGYRNFKRLERAFLLTCMQLSDVSNPPKELVLVIAKEEAKRAELDGYLTLVLLSVVGEISSHFEYNTLN